MNTRESTTEIKTNQVSLDDGEGLDVAKQKISELENEQHNLNKNGVQPVKYEWIELLVI